jgi:prephenate dehydratase
VTTPAASAPSATATASAGGPRRLGYLGPAGTFTEEALFTQPDLRDLELVKIHSIPDVLAAAAAGEVDLGFVAIENAIEGSVNVTLDSLAFETDLRIEREVIIGVHLNLMALPGTKLEDIKRVITIPIAMAQCRQYLAEHLPGVEKDDANSTAGAARLVAENADPTVAAIAPARSAEVYGLDIIGAEVEDHPENATRFVVVGHDPIPAATGHDKTSVVIFQRADAPGSLLSILQEFAARNINLSKLESRPTKKVLGDYCFLIDLEGHIDDELVADCLRDLKSKHTDVKFLGSYPAAGEHGPAVRRDADAAWRKADAWIKDLRSQIER